MSSYGPYPGAYPPPPPPYGYPPQPIAPRNGLGITALVLAVLGLVFSWSIIGGIILGIAAVVLGFLGRGRVTRGEANNAGIAIAGIVLGVLAVVVSAAFIAIWIGFFKDVGFGSYIDCIEAAGNDPAGQAQCEQQFRDKVQSDFGVTSTPTR